MPDVDDLPPAGDSGKQTPVEERSLWGYFVKCLKNYATFSGRARRMEFWEFYLFYAGIAALLSLVSSHITLMTHFPVTPAQLFLIALLLPGVAVFVRRMHDIGKSGWNAMYALIPVTGWIAFLVFGPVALDWFFRIVPYFGQGESDAIIDLLFVIMFVLVMMMIPVLIGLFVAILFTVWACQNSQPGPNKYGENPKGQERLFED